MGVHFTRHFPSFVCVRWATLLNEQARRTMNFAAVFFALFVHSEHDVLLGPRRWLRNAEKVRLAANSPANF